MIDKAFAYLLLGTATIISGAVLCSVLACVIDIVTLKGSAPGNLIWIPMTIGGLMGIGWFVFQVWEKLP